jgi:aminoglycoside phosphotransferase (APT) family kinase protein
MGRGGTVTQTDDDRPQLTTSTRDREELRRKLLTWLGTKVEDPVLTDLVVPESNGMSSETLLFDVSFRRGTGHGSLSCAARLAPDPAAAPVFPVYDLERQYRVMRLVGGHSQVPVPATLWLEPDEAHLGAPFFVMEQVAGLVPPDVMPYTFGSWLTEASAQDRKHLQDAAVGVLAQIHSMNLAPADVEFLQLPRAGDSALRRHLADLVAYYEWVSADGIRSPLIERALGWLEDHWPKEEGDSVVSWGDARIGNMMFVDFEPVAVLDWEMAAVGPAEIDLGWMIYLHRFLDDIAMSAGMSGMGRFMQMDDVAVTYEALTAHAPRDLEFYGLYAALRHAVVMSRVARRQVLFGEMQMPEDPDDMIMHRASLELMLEGAYWQQF